MTAYLANFPPVQTKDRPVPRKLESEVTVARSTNMVSQLQGDDHLIRRRLQRPNPEPKMADRGPFAGFA